MAGQRITEYIRNEEVKLQKLFNDYRVQSKEITLVKAGRALQVLLSQIQAHALFEEKNFFPFSGRLNNNKEVEIQIDFLRKDHECMCELIAMMMKKEEEGTTSVEEQDAFHVLLVNHLKREEEVLDALDECLTEKERQAADYMETIRR